MKISKQQKFEKVSRSINTYLNDITSNQYGFFCFTIAKDLEKNDISISTNIDDLNKAIDLLKNILVDLENRNKLNELEWV